MDSETIQLILDLGASGANVEDVRQKLEGLKGSVTSTAESYQVLSTVIDKSVGGAGSYAIATDRLNEELDAEVRKAHELTQAHKALAMALNDGGGAQAAAANMKGLNMAMVGAAYGAQDFVTVMSMGGGFGRALMSVSNNITPILLGLGLGGGMAGVLGLVVTAAAAAVPAVEKLGFTLDAGIKMKIPDSIDKIERLTVAIKRDKEAIEELTKKRELDYWEMQKYNDGVSKLRKNEEELALAREARQVGPGQAKADRERAAAFREALQEYGGGDRLIEVLRETGRTEKEAENMVVDAQRGAKGAAERIQAALRGRGANNQIGWISPDQQRRQQLQMQQTEAILRRRAEEAREADRKAEQLNREGQRNEEAAQRQRDAEQRKDQRGAEHQLQQDIRISRRVGEAARHAPPKPPTGHIPVMPADATAQEWRNAMMLTQQQLTENQAALRAQLAQARGVGQRAARVGRQIQQPMANNGIN